MLALAATLATACSERDPTPPARADGGVVTSRPTTTVDSGPGCPPVSDDDVGLSLGGHWPFLDPAEQEADLDAAVDLGARWIRIDLNWSNIERQQGTYDFRRWDAIVQAADDRCLRILGILLNTPVWARAPGCDDRACIPTDLDAFGRFVAATVERYQGRIDHWEVWNEPNLFIFYRPRPDPAHFARLLARAVDAIRATSPDAFIVAGGLSPVLSNGNGRRIGPVDFVHAVLASEAGRRGMAEVDAIGYHPYTFPVAPTVSTGRSGWVDLLPEVKAALEAAGLGDKPIWLTEMGSATGIGEFAVSDAQQARDVAEAFELWRADHDLGPLFWFSLRDETTDDGNLNANFGLLEHDRSEKDAYGVFRELTRAAG